MMLIERGNEITLCHGKVAELESEQPGAIEQIGIGRIVLEQFFKLDARLLELAARH
ncbi:hypothetical protein GKE73_10215 [Paludibacterium sp. dN 18-1]|uniref:Uncharacterized protein n=1 Tax=Paludibacterium denitrificans TaxID=2675226 RepID=A0A844GFQ2_9NEIS|nr:hypothetical protein [Paludibacterium denitrificans]